MSGGFFRGTSADQDTRFSNKQAKLLKSQKFPPELEILVDMSKVKLDVMKPWIAKRVTELIGFEDEVLINFIYTLLEGKVVNGKQIQISLTGFMERNTGKFMKELWTLLISAQQNASGVPQEFLDAKEEETKKKKAETDRIANEIHMKREKEKKELDEEKIKMDGRRATLREKHSIAENDTKHEPADEDERLKRNGSRRHRRASRSSGSTSRSPSPRRKRLPSPNKSSNSASGSDGRRSRSISGAPKSRSRSVSSERRRRSSPRRSITPHRRHNARRSPSPPRRRSPPSRQRSISRTRRRSPSPSRYRVRSSWRYRSRSPLRRRSRSPRRRRSRTPVRRSSRQYRSRSPVRRRSPSPVRGRSPSPVRGRSPSPVRGRSPSPVRRRPASIVRGRSPSPDHERSVSPVRRRSPPPARRRSPPPARRRSPPPARRGSPSQYGRRPPVHRRRSPVPTRRRESPSTPTKRSTSPVPVRSSMHDRNKSLTPVNRRSPSDHSSRSPSPIGRRSLSPVQRRSPRRGARSPEKSPGRRVRSRKEYSPDRHASPVERTERLHNSQNEIRSSDRKPVVLLRSPQRDSQNFDDDQGKDRHLSPSVEKYKSSDSSKDKSHGGEQRSTSPRGSPSAKRERIAHPESLSSLPKAVGSKSRHGDTGSKANDRDSLARRETGEPKLSSLGKVSPTSIWRKDSLDSAEISGLPDVAKSRKTELTRSSKLPDRADRKADRESEELSTIYESGVNKKGKDSSDSDRVIDKKRAQSDDRKGNYAIEEEESLSKASKKSEKNGSVASDSMKIDDHRVKEKRKHGKLDRGEAVSDDYSSEDSYEDRREAKKRRKEEKKLKKEERRRRREERRRRKEEKRAEKLKSKSVDSGSSSSDLEQDHSEDDAVLSRNSQSKNQESESQQKKLEIELREKALESLRAKRGTGN